MHCYIDSNLMPLLIIGILLAFFGLLILIIIIVKRHVSSLQITKDEIDEKEAIQQELDRILVPIDDEKIQQQMADTNKEKEEKVTKTDEKKN